MSGKYKKEIHRKRADYRRSVIARYKTIKGCVDCGYAGHHSALEFDHLPEFEKNRTVASMMYSSWEVIKAEIAKCEIICSNCHSIRTWQRKNQMAQWMELAYTVDLKSTAARHVGSNPTWATRVSLA